MCFGIKVLPLSDRLYNYNQNMNIIKTFGIAALLGLMPIAANAQASDAYYTKPSPSAELTKKASKWLKKGEWRQGYTGADPDKSVNIVEFYTQYQKNPEQWKALFAWLAKTDLLALTKGKHPIPGSKLVASVEDDENGDLAKRGSESHYHHIDFQFVVKGSERFGILDHITSKPNSKYRPDVIHYDYDVKRTKFIDSKTDKFLIFFPCDWHIAKVKTDKEDQHIRVVVVKVDYVD